MIYTRYGSPVEITAVIQDEPDIENSITWLEVKYLDRGGRREVHISDLKADDGIEEILQAVKHAQKFGDNLA